MGMEERAAQQGVNTVNQVSRSLMQWFDMMSKNGIDLVRLLAPVIIDATKNMHITKELKESLDKGNVYAFAGDKKTMESMEKWMDERGIPYVDKELSGMKQEMAIVPDRYRDLVKTKYAELMLGRGMEQTPEGMNAYNPDGNFKQVTNLDTARAELLKSICDQKEIPYTVLERENGTYSVAYAEKDEPAMQRARIDMLAMSSGRQGQVFSKQLDWINRNYQDMERHLSQDLPNETVHYVDGTGKEITARGNEFVYTDGNIKIEAEGPYKRSDLHSTQEIREYRDYTQQVRATLGSMENTAVRLTDAEYKQYKMLPEEKRMDFVIQKQREQGRPMITEEEMHLCVSMDTLMPVIEKKVTDAHPSLSSAADFEPVDIKPSVIAMTTEEIDKYKAFEAGEEKMSESEFMTEEETKEMLDADRDIRCKDLEGGMDTVIRQDSMFSDRHFDELNEDFDRNRGVDDMLQDAYDMNNIQQDL